jgi:cephalosporin hydroxylase
MSDFEAERETILNEISRDADFSKVSKAWMNHSASLKQSYLYDWLGIPIIQIPQDIYALQEIIFRVKPDLIIETGIARGGSLQLSASLLAMLDVADFLEGSPQNVLPKRKVVGIDIEIRAHAKLAIENSFLKPWIVTLENDSSDISIIPKLEDLVSRADTVMVILDSDHTKSHVSKELEIFSKYVTPGSYLVVFDTVIAFLDSQLPGRTWGPGNGPLDAVNDFLRVNSGFEEDSDISTKLSISCAPHGFLKRR